MKKTILLILAVLGVVLPMSQFIPASIEGEFSLGGMFSEMTATRTITGVTLDFLVVVFTALVFAAWETVRLKIRFVWIPLIGTFLIGASFGLPFFLYLRERALESGRRRPRRYGQYGGGTNGRVRGLAQALGLFLRRARGR